MKNKLLAGIAAAILIGALTACSNEQVKESAKAQPSVDSISKASTHFYYEASALKGKELFDSINKREGSVTIATVNSDGSPNLAIAVPGVVGDKYLTFGFASNQTVENLKREKLGVVSYYIYTPDAESKTDRNRGARIIVEYVDDPAKIAEIKNIMGDDYSNSSTYLEIVKTLPLG